MHCGIGAEERRKPTGHGQHNVQHWLEHAEQSLHVPDPDREQNLHHAHRDGDQRTNDLGQHLEQTDGNTDNRLDDLYEDLREDFDNLHQRLEQSPYVQFA